MIVAVRPVRRVDTPTFPEMLERLYVEKHTGPVIVHLGEGVPNAVEIPGEATLIKLEKR